MAEIKGKDNFSVAPTVGGTVVSLDGHNHDHDALTNFVANEHINHSTLTLTAGTGLSGGGVLTISRTLNLDITELTADASPDGAADYVVTYDASATTHKKVLLNNLPGGGGGGCDFTEEWTNLGRPSSQSTWQEKTITGATANTIVEIQVINDTNGSQVIGVRETTSSTNRYLSVVKDGTASWITKTDANGKIDWYSESTNSGVNFWFSGEFS